MKKENKILDNLFIRYSKGDRKYLVFPNVSFPRIIIPVLNWRVYARGLKVQNTASFKNRIIKNIILLIYPLLKLLSYQKVSITPEFNSILQILRNKVGFENLLEYSFFIGTSSSNNRKLTILLINKHYSSLGIIKYPLMKDSEAYIRNEYETLIKLSQYQFNNLIIPQKFKSIFVNGKEILFQEDIFGGASTLKNKLNSIIVNASIELSDYTRKTDVIDYFNNLIKNALKLPIDNNIINHLKEKAQEIIKKQVPLITIHGDFVLYNMKMKNSKLALIDWEYSRSGLPLFDLFHFVFQGKYQIEKMKLTNCIKEVFSEKNIDHYKYYLRKLSIGSEIIKTLFLFYIIDALLYDIRVKRNIKIEKNHFYKALIFYYKF